MNHGLTSIAVTVGFAMASLPLLSSPASAAMKPQRISGAAEHRAATASPSFRRAGSAETASAPAIGTNVELNQDEGAHPTVPHNEVAVAVNPANPDNIVAGANDYRNGSGGESGFYSSSNGGATWTDGAFAPGGVMPSGVDSAGDPALAFNDNGTRLYYSQIAFSTTAPLSDGCDATSGVYVAVSTNGGTQWAQAKAVATNSSTVFNDKPWVTVDAAGTVLVTYTKFVFGLASDCIQKNTGDSPIKMKRSTNGGTSWGSEIDVSGPYTASQGSVPVVAPNSNVYVAFEGSGPGCVDCIVVARSTDGGQSFAAQTKLADITGLLELKADTQGGTVRADSFPSMAVASNGTLYVVWAEQRGGNPDADVWISTSTNGGTSWSASPLRVNQVAAGDQFFPSVAVDSAGTVWVSYSDRRGDSNNVLYRQYVSHSHDGGATWTDTAVASAPSDPGAVVFSGGVYFIGDYNGIAAIPGGGAFTAWTDTRNSSQSGGQQDAFGALITTSGAPTLTASVSPVIAVIGTTFSVSGKLMSDGVGRSGKSISIQQRPVGSSLWTAVATATTGSGGTYAAGVGKPSSNADYRAVFAGDSQVLAATSGIDRASVRVGVIFNSGPITLPRGATARFSGAVVPAHPGRRVMFQQLTGAGWRTIATIGLDGSSTYRASARITTNGNRLYRVAFATQDSDHAWNISRNIMIHWT